MTILSWARPRLPWLTICAVTLVVFGAVRGFDYVAYDDAASIYSDPYLNPVTAGHVWYFWRHSYDSIYTPITSTARAAIALVAGLPAPYESLSVGTYRLDPHKFHLANLLLHLANVLLVYSLLRLFFSRPWAAACGALLFAIHPLQVESVAWITEMKGVLCAFFELVALRQYLCAVDTAPDDEAAAVSQSAGRRLTLRMLATLCYLLALLSKPSAVMLPALAWLLANLRRSQRGRARMSQPYGLLVLWCALALVLVALTRQSQPVPVSLVLPLWKRGFVAGDALAFYLLKLVAPFHLSTHYGRTPATVLAQPWGYWMWLLPAVVDWLAWRGRAGRPWLPVAAALFAVALLPNLGFLPFIFQLQSTVADRYIYLPMLGPALALAGCLQMAKPRAYGAAAALLGMLGLLTVTQAACWRDTGTLFEHTLASSPNSWVAHESLGTLYGRQGDVVRSDNEFQAALKIEPGSALLHSDYAGMLLAHGRSRQALGELQTALALDPDNQLGRYNLGVALVAVGKPGAAIPQFKKALDSDPDNASIHLNLANALAATDGSEAAAREYGVSLGLDPDLPTANSNYGLFLLHHGDPRGARARLQQAVRLSPTDAEAQFNLGLTWAQLNRMPEAEQSFTNAIRLNPRYVEAHYNLGIVAILTGRRAMALEQWQRALQIDPSYFPARQAIATASGRASR